MTAKKVIHTPLHIKGPRCSEALRERLRRSPRVRRRRRRRRCDLCARRRVSRLQVKTRTVITIEKYARFCTTNRPPKLLAAE